MTAQNDCIESEMFASTYNSGKGYLSQPTALFCTMFFTVDTIPCVTLGFCFPYYYKYLNQCTEIATSGFLLMLLQCNEISHILI